MAHEIWNGKAIYTGKREDVWHEIGIYVGEEKLTSGRILSEAGLDYEVTKHPMTIARTINGETVHYPSNRFAVCRDGVAEDLEGEGNPVQLGVVTANYQILQNADAFKPFDPLVDAGLLEYTAAGALMNGARVWIAAKMTGIKTEDTIVRETKEFVDTVEAYWLLYNGHDGQTAVNIALTGIRPVCFNTVSMAIVDESAVTGGAIKARHASNVLANVEAATKTLEKANERFAGMMAAYRKMAAVALTDARIEQFFKRTFPTIDGAAWSTRRANQVEKMTQLAVSGVGNNGSTVWDLFNGATEYFDHAATDDAMRNMESSWFGSRRDQRGDAFRAAMELVNAA